MSENDESNIEAPSPVTPVKSPEKVPEAPATPVKKEENVVAPIPVPELNSQPETPRSTPPSPQTPQVAATTPVEPAVAPPTPTSLVDQKGVVKPGVLRFGQEDYPIGTFTGTKPPTSSKSRKFLLYINLNFFKPHTQFRG